MVKIIVIADTHYPKRAKKLPGILLKELEDTDLIIHAGDWQTIDVYDELMKYAKVEGVYGNVDSEDIMQRLPEKIILHIDDYKIGVTHGHGKGKTTERRVLDHFEGEELDCIIYGHSHIPVLKKLEQTIVFNPGSPTDKRKQQRYSFGIIMMDEDGINARHVFFDSRE